MVTQAATADRIVVNSPLIDRMLTEQKNNKSRQVELLQEHLTSKAVEETCLPLMKEEWIEKSFKPTWQLAATVVYFMRKNLFKKVSVESIADEFKLKKQQLYKLVTGKSLKVEKQQSKWTGKCGTRWRSNVHVSFCKMKLYIVALCDC